MEIAVCHELKSDRKDICNGLPPALKLVPVLFYVSVAACSLAMIWFWVGIRSAKTQSSRWTAQTTHLKGQSANVAKQHGEIMALNAKATRVAEWMDGAHSLQPLSVGIARSVGSEASIAELLLTRNSEIPSQIKLSLKMDDVSSKILDSTLDSIRMNSFRPYSAQQTKKGHSLDYTATLVWQASQGRPKS